MTVWILAHDSGYDFPHAVVITGMDDTRKEITYNDPAYGTEVTITQSQFISRWEKLDQRMMKEKIGRLTRPTLEQFMNNGSGGI